MQKKHEQATQIAREQRNISNYAGLLFARITLLICLFFLLIALRPTSFYIFVFIVLFPWIFSNYLLERQNYPEIILHSCAKKYFFNPARLTAEKYTETFIILFLIVWQFSLNSASLSFEILRPAPSFLLLIYLVSRMLITVFTRHKIYKYYTELTILD